MRPWLLAVLVLATAFAGCADEGTADLTTTEPAEDHDHDGHDHGNETAHHNTAPVANLTADALNGTAPLLVNLTLDGSDADGDNLTWSLQVNGTEAANGTVLPATLALNFTAGNHTLLLTVSDGNASTSANLTVAVAPAGPAVDANAPEDRGWYMYDPVTKLCHVNTYDDVQGLGLVYTSPLSGGNWVIAETNDVDGLQIADNHPASPAGSTGGFALDLPDCEDGDQVLV